MLLAVGLSFRPQVILFIPAYLLAIDGVVRPAGESWRPTMRATLEWGLAWVVCLALVFAPLVFTGLWHDFLFGQWGLSLVSPRGDYNTDSLSFRLVKFIKPVNLPVIAVVWMSTLVAVKHPERRRLYLTWLTAFFLAAIYRPLSPHVDHEYLSHPFYLVLSVCFALTAFGICRLAELSPLVRLTALGLLLALAMPTKPRYVGLASLHYTSAIVKGTKPTNEPPSYLEYRRRIDPAIARYAWTDYQAVLEYLGRHTTQETRVANLLYYTPAILGNVRRPSVFPTPALNWPKSVPSVLALYVRRLEEATDSVVIWSPKEPSPDHPQLFEAFRPIIERDYEFDTRFGEIEVWRRKIRSGFGAPSSKPS
jgi:hypothetical protein